MNIKEDGLEIITEKAVELKKDDFFKLLASKPEGLELTIDRLGNTYTSKWANDKGETPSGFFIDYSFTNNNKEYQVGISYNVGVPVAEETFILKSGMNLFKILAVATDISKAKEVKVTKKFLEDTLTGISFIGKVGAGFNSFIIEPVRKI